MNNPIDLFRELLISFGLNGAADIQPAVLGIILIALLVLVLRLVRGVIENVVKIVLTIATVGAILWVLYGMFA